MCVCVCVCVCVCSGASAVIALIFQFNFQTHFELLSSIICDHFFSFSAFIHVCLILTLS